MFCIAGYQLLPLVVQSRDTKILLICGVIRISRVFFFFSFLFVSFRFFLFLPFAKWFCAKVKG